MSHHNAIHAHPELVLVVLAIFALVVAGMALAALRSS